MTTLARRLTPTPQMILWGLLMINGLLIALMLALSKSATSQGMPPITYAFWQTLLAGLILLMRSGSPSALFVRKRWTYFFVSGLAGIAIPNVTAFYLVTKLGAGFTGIMYALPPVFTFLIAASMGLEKRSGQKLLGLSITVLACGWIVLQRHSEVSQFSSIWYAVGMVIPVMLSIGNIYRSVAWPVGANPTTLAAGTLLASAMSLAVFAQLTGTTLLPAKTSTEIFVLVVVQGGVTALAYLCSFEIQRRSDPVFYSQLGAVAAVFGLLIGVIWFREEYSVMIWLGVAFVITGLKVSNRSRGVSRSSVSHNLGGK